MSDIVPVPIEEELSDSYLSYAMSVIVSRAIPDVRDGLKPVHRRILYAMYASGFLWGKPYRKSARVVGEVIGKYHPHGDTAVYDSLARMAQDFSLRLPLIDGQGNFGSVDGDPPASMRYTEVKLLPVAEFLLRDLKEDTVDFRPNYDGLETEPSVLPAEFPNILVNGSSGVAVGMATNIPTHNLGEVVDAACLRLSNPNCTLDELLEVFKGPDFPTGGVIVGLAGFVSACQTGRGSIIIRGKSHVETVAGKNLLVIDEIPYQVNKAKLVESIAALVREKKVEGITDLRDESNKKGMRVVVELKKGVETDLIFNQLCRLTQLQVSFGINMMVLDGKKPILMSVFDVLDAFLHFRREAVTRRVEFRLRKARERAHLVIALCIALINIDEVVAIIKSSEDAKSAAEALVNRGWNVDEVLVGYISIVSGVDFKQQQCRFTEDQAKAILEMRLQRLTGMERQKLDAELETLIEAIRECVAILDSPERVRGIIESELKAVKSKFATDRLTEIQEHAPSENEEDFVPKEPVVVIVTVSGYVKRVHLSCYRTQNRGGRGKSNYDSDKHEDLVRKVFVASTHDSVLFFSNTGQVYRLKVYKLPRGEPNTRGRALVNVFPLASNEIINNVMPIPECQEGLSIVFSTSSGKIRRNLLTDFDYIPSTGKIAIKLCEGDHLVAVKVCTEEADLLLSSKKGKSIRFPVGALRIFKGRTSDGVRGIKLAKGDEVISMTVLNSLPDGDSMDERGEYLKMPVQERRKITEITEGKAKMFAYAQREQFILTITVNGFGKRTSAYEYRRTSRGGVGVTNIITSKRNGEVVASFPVEDSDEVVMVTDQGQIIRIKASGIRITSRGTQGVTLFRTEKGESVVSVAKIEDPGESEIDI